MANYKEIREKRVSGDHKREERIRRERRLLELDVNLAELRRKRGLSQRSLADALEVSQANVSRIEHEGDVQLSTLAGYVQGLGGRLELRAVFEDENVQLTEA